jgi:hypothetical protein
LTDDQIELIKQKARERKSGSQHSGRSNTMDVEIQPEIFVEKRAKQPIARDIMQREKLMFNSQSILQSPEGYPFTQCLKTVQVYLLLSLLCEWRIVFPNYLLLTLIDSNK